jgi:hypothetical protein
MCTLSMLLNKFLCKLSIHLKSRLSFRTSFDLKQPMFLFYNSLQVLPFCSIAAYSCMVCYTAEFDAPGSVCSTAACAAI